MTTPIQTTTTGCVAAKAVFQHPLVEEPPTSNSPAADRHQYQALVRRAESVCSACPLAKQCLYDAVVNFDVDGFAAGTTRKQRMQIRAKLGIEVAPEDFDTLAGVTARHRQVDHAEVVRLRNANPHESLETIAQRLGCSLSTVKRHLRRARSEAAANVTPITRERRVSMRQVLEAFHAVMRPVRPATPARRAA